MMKEFYISGPCLYAFKSPVKCKHTEAGGELIKCQISISIGVQSVKDVLKLFTTQWQLSV